MQFTDEEVALYVRQEVANYARMSLEEKAMIARVIRLFQMVERDYGTAVALGVVARMAQVSQPGPGGLILPH